MSLSLLLSLHWIVHLLLPLLPLLKLPLKLCLLEVDGAQQAKSLAIHLQGERGEGKKKGRGEAGGGEGTYHTPTHNHSLVMLVNGRCTLINTQLRTPYTVTNWCGYHAMLSGETSSCYRANSIIVKTTMGLIPVMIAWSARLLITRGPPN